MHTTRPKSKKAEIIEAHQPGQVQSGYAVSEVINTINRKYAAKKPER